MYSEAFGRYDPKLFRRFFLSLLEQLDFSKIPEIKSLGRFILVDGSIFPALRTMAWAAYTSTGNALKMHLAFELNRMVPVQFISTDANGNEKEALLALLEAGVTVLPTGAMSLLVFLGRLPACRPFSSSVSKLT